MDNLYLDMKKHTSRIWFRSMSEEVLGLCYFIVAYQAYKDEYYWLAIIFGIKSIINFISAFFTIVAELYILKKETENCEKIQK